MSIDRSLDSLANTFSVESTTRWNLDSKTDISIRIDEGDPVEVWFDGAQLLSGYVDEVSESLGPDSWSVSISGRSKAGDLCDCSAAPKTWRNTPALDIARALCEPFGIGVVVAPGVVLETSVRRFKADGDDTVQECLERLAKVAGVRVVSDSEGDIQFTGPGSRRALTALVFGENIQSLYRSQSGADRFSNYFFRVQRSGTGDLYGSDAAHVKASVVDEGVTRHRPLRVQAERQGSVKELERRAAWERNTRAGRAYSLVVDFQALERTWRCGPGLSDIWDANLLVDVDIPVFGIECETMLISQVTLTFGEDGYGASLRLTAPEAYLPDKPPLKKKKKGGSTGW